MAESSELISLTV